MLVHLVSMDQEADSENTAAARSNRAALGATVASGGLGRIRCEGWHSERDVYAVAARGACGGQAMINSLVLRDKHGAAGTNRRLVIKVTIRTRAGNTSAYLGGIAQNERCRQNENRCGRLASSLRLHGSPVRGQAKDKPTHSQQTTPRVAVLFHAGGKDARYVLNRVGGGLLPFLDEVLEVKTREFTDLLDELISFDIGRSKSTVENRAVPIRSFSPSISRPSVSHSRVRRSAFDLRIDIL